MFDRLPVELGIRIVEHAAYTLRFSHRQSVVNLSATSKTIYAIVTPILSHTMIVTNENAHQIRSFMSNGGSDAARICAHVRVLVHDVGIGRKLEPVLLVSLECAHALGDVIKQAASNSIDDPCLLRQINVLSVDFAEDVTRLPENARRTITHASGFLPLFDQASEWRRLHQTPEVWMRQITDKLSALTHLGLVLVDARRAEEEDSTIRAFNLHSLSAAIEVALTYPQLQQVALRICGRYIDEPQQEIENMLQRIIDSRFRVWRDERPLYSWDDWNDLMHEDVIAGRDIWTEARAV